MSAHYRTSGQQLSKLHLRRAKYILINHTRSDQYLYLGGPLLAGLFVVGGAALAPMILPMGMRSLAVTEAISLYGGLAVFGGFVLYE